jgi:predicted secreted protein
MARLVRAFAFRRHAMSSNAIETQGMQLQIGDGATPEVFTKISEIKNFSGPGGSASVINVASLDSTAQEKRMGLVDEGQLQFTINYVPADPQHAALRAARASREQANFRLIFTDTGATQWDFAAFVTGFSVSGGVDAVVEAQVTLEITGAITES